MEGVFLWIRRRKRGKGLRNLAGLTDSLLSVLRKRSAVVADWFGVEGGLALGVPGLVAGDVSELHGVAVVGPRGPGKGLQAAGRG